MGYNEENYFVLGDNREDSVDSRNEALGLVKGEDVLGKVFLTVWPIGEIKSYQGNTDLIKKYNSN